MLSILNLFGRSPFAPLQAHMEDVASCVRKLLLLCNALEEGNQVLIEQVAEEISSLEHKADLVKSDIRNHLPKSLYLPIDRQQLLEILSIQDRIADAAKDAAVLLALKPLVLLPEFAIEFKIFLQKNVDTFEGAHKIIHEMHDLVESSFGGKEAQKVSMMVNEVGQMEHEVDIIQRDLLKKLFESENHLTFITFFQWQKIFVAIASISNHSESLANRVRTTLQIK